ncbi:nitroreductase family deazaflavin-dependent oxidoreductase [Spiractinospora alimapuensis]|nr:nitroreductase family deazaflavin-dependent oxidoreductase [Spiractinospora alimapuensis]
MFEGARLLLLTTTGARSGEPHTTPLGYLHGESGEMIVIASAGGAPTHPAWYHNVRANPKVTVESDNFTYTAEARVLVGEERDTVFRRAAVADPGWQEYQDNAGRTLPVVALTMVDGGPNAEGGWGDALVAIHATFRRELALVRAEVAASGGSIGAQLRINCLSVCEGLHTHHHHEDAGVFPSLAEGNPELRPALERLGEEHKEIARLVDELQAVIREDDRTPAELLATVDRLIADLEAHLDYEEEHLVPVLNGLSLDG